MASLVLIFDSACDLLLRYNRLFSSTTDGNSIRSNNNNNSNKNNNKDNENVKRREFGKLSNNSNDLHETARLLLPFLAARKNLKLAARNGLEVIIGGEKGRERIALVAADLRGDRGTIVVVVKGKSGQWAARYAVAAAELLDMTIGKDLNKLKGDEQQQSMSAILSALNECPEELWFASVLPSVDCIFKNSKTFKIIADNAISALPSKNLSAFAFSNNGKMLAKSVSDMSSVLDMEQLWMLGVCSAKAAADEIILVHIRKRGATMPALIKRIVLIDGRVLMCLKTLPEADADSCRHLDRLEFSAKRLLDALDSYCIPYNNKMLSDFCRCFWNDCKAFNESSSEQKLPLRAVQEAVLSHFKSTGDAKPALVKFLRDLTRDLDVLYRATARALERSSQILAEFAAEVQESVEKHRFSSEISSVMSACSKNAHGIAAAITVGRTIQTWVHIDLYNGILRQEHQDSYRIWESIAEGSFVKVTSLESRGGTLAGLRCVLHRNNGVFLDAISWLENCSGGLVRPSDNQQKMRLYDLVKSVICGPVTLFHDFGCVGATATKCENSHDLPLHLLICLSTVR